MQMQPRELNNSTDIFLITLRGCHRDALESFRLTLDDYFGLGFHLGAPQYFSFKESAQVKIIVTVWLYSEFL